VDEAQAGGAEFVDPVGDAAEPTDHPHLIKQKRKRKDETNFKLECTICAEDHIYIDDMMIHILLKYLVQTRLRL
jgi:hypothetical protein